MTTTFLNHPTMAWTHQRFKNTSNDCINLKAFWKKLILDDSHDEKGDIQSNNVSSIFYRSCMKNSNMKIDCNDLRLRLTRI